MRTDGRILEIPDDICYRSRLPRFNLRRPHALIQLSMSTPSNPQQRQDINSRLDSLVKDPPAMPIRRFSIVRRPSASAPASPAPRLKHLTEDVQRQQQPAPPSQPSSGPASPILRWFQTQVSSPSPSRPQSPHSAALSEAMHDYLPTRPEPAHLPPQYHANIRPPMLDELTRSTLPTSSLTTPPLTDRLGHHTPDPGHPLLFDRIPPSAPARKSLDTLRTLYTRTIPATPLHQQTRSITIPTPFRNWFQTESAKDADKHKYILTEEDQHEDSEIERENIRKKCKYPAGRIYHWHNVERPFRSLSEQPCRILSRPSWLRLCHYRTSHCPTGGHPLARNQGSPPDQRSGRLDHPRSRNKQPGRQSAGVRKTDIGSVPREEDPPNRFVAPYPVL